MTGMGCGRIAEVTRDLDAIADEIDVHREASHPIYLPPELARAARRIVAAADGGRAHVIDGLTPTGEAVLQVIDATEVVTVAIVRDRLAKAEHVASEATITVSLHQACVRGDLVSTDHGRFRLPTAEERMIIEAARDGNADTASPPQ